MSVTRYVTALHVAYVTKAPESVTYVTPPYKGAYVT
jgi:hypothetical protein